MLGWNIFASAFDEFLFSVPPQLRTGDSWYLGTADAVGQNLYILQERSPRRVLILSGDHIYKMDYSEMIESHVRTGAMVTVAAVECDLNSARRLGVLEIDGDSRVLTFEEKPDNPKTISVNLRTSQKARRAETLTRISIGFAACASFPLKLKSHEVKSERIAVLLAGGNL